MKKFALILCLIGSSAFGQNDPLTQVFAQPVPSNTYPTYKLNSDGSLSFRVNWPNTTPGQIVSTTVEVQKVYPSYKNAMIPPDPSEIIWWTQVGAGVVQAKPDGSATLLCMTTGADFSDPTVTFRILLKTTVMYWNGKFNYTWYNTFDKFIVSY